MHYAVIIPAHNEAAFLPQMLTSLGSQTLIPCEAVVVDDHSSDTTKEAALQFANAHPWIRVLSVTSQASHLPGSKVIAAFQNGFAQLTCNYDIIVKLDADLILPNNYFEKVIGAFNANPKLGIAGGFAYIEKDGEWILESLTDNDHVRGAFKAYRKECFEQIGGLRPAMGWDTVDELLAKFYGWEVITLPDLKVKHLKPTGANYNKAARYKQGEAFYTLGYGFIITAIASVKLAMMKKKPLLFLDYISGFLRAAKRSAPLLVSPEQAKFIRSYRWKKMREKLFGKSGRQS